MRLVAAALKSFLLPVALTRLCCNRCPWLGSRVGIRNPPGTSQVVGQLLHGFVIEVSKVDHGYNPFRCELNIVVDGSDKLMKYFLIHNTSLHQHEIKLQYFHGLLVSFCRVR
jgi:hypothetical protein